MNFRSDNESTVAPEIMAAISAANCGHAPAYGADAWSARLDALFATVFETQVRVFPVFTGTGANAIALAQVCPPYGAILCHEGAHVHADECGAPEFHTGGAKLVPIAGAGGKLSVESVTGALGRFGFHGVHEPLPAAVSLAQASEAGTVYTPDELAAMGALAGEHGLALHMDGARFANAVAFLGCTPAQASWRAGVDLMSFGATKNGALCAEAVVVFDAECARGLDRRRKRAGHLASKMRYLSAQFEAYFADDLWLRLAGRANRLTRRLGDGIDGAGGVAIHHPVEANELFVRLAPELRARLAEAGFAFHNWPGDGPGDGPDDDGLVRLVCAHDTPEADVEALIACVTGARVGA